MHCLNSHATEPGDLESVSAKKILVVTIEVVDVLVGVGVSVVRAEAIVVTPLKTASVASSNSPSMSPLPSLLSPVQKQRRPPS